jgi:subtilisin family serine protease
MTRAIGILAFMLLFVPFNLASFVYLDPGEIAVNVGLQSAQDREDILAFLESEYDGVLVKEIRELGVLSLIIDEEDFPRLRQALAFRVRYIEEDRLSCLPELPSLLDSFFLPRRSEEGAQDDGNTPVLYPNDPRYGQQWGPPAIDAERAWNFVPQNHDVILAIIDTGVDVSHEDLVGNYDPSIDKDIVNNDNDANDDMGHGTHCAGIAAAVTNNDTGIAGLAPVTIMGVKVLTWLGAGTDVDIADGINYAANNGADVISLSLGSTTYASVMHSACDNAFYNHNVVVIAAAGNSNTSQKTYPAAHPSVIGVAALETSTQRASFSNYGYDNVEISAPGVAIHSTLPDHATFWNLFGIFPFDYGDMDGTSMACPHVAGVAAGYRAFRETLSAQTVRDLLGRWADDLGDPYYYGNGRVDYYPPDSKMISGSTEISSLQTAAIVDPGSDRLVQLLRYRALDVEVFDGNMKPVAMYTRFTEDVSLNSFVEPLPSGEYIYRVRVGDKVSELRKVLLP